MPAAAVIPAPIAYIKVVVVKKLVVGSQFVRVGLSLVGSHWLRRTMCRRRAAVPFAGCCSRSASLL